MVLLMKLLNKILDWICFRSNACDKIISPNRRAQRTQHYYSK